MHMHYTSLSFLLLIVIKSHFLSLKPAVGLTLLHSKLCTTPSYVVALVHLGAPSLPHPRVRIIIHILLGSLFGRGRVSLP